VQQQVFETEKKSMSGFIKKIISEKEIEKYVQKKRKMKINS